MIACLSSTACLMPAMLVVALTLSVWAVQGGAAAAPIRQTTASSHFVPGELLVKPRQGVARQAVLSALSADERASSIEVSELGVTKVYVLPGDEGRRAAELSVSPGIEYAEPNYIAHALDVPNDPNLSRQWAITRIRAPEAWDFFHGGPDVTVAVVDTGIEGDHEDLSAKMVAGYDYVAGQALAAGASIDDHGHGTHVAGIATAITNNALGVAGVSWGARLMPVKVLNSTGNGTYEDVALGVRYAANHGARVINLSLGGEEDSQTLKEAVDYAAELGCLLVAAAGNDGTGVPFYPAAYSNVIAVGSVNSDDQKSWFSNWGTVLDLVAPGESIYSTYTWNGYAWLQGTSMAAPFVSGLGALLWSACPGDSSGHIRQAIETTAVDVGPSGWDETFGYGRIDAEAAVHYYYDLSAAPQDILFLADDDTIPAARNLDVSAVNRCGAFSSVTWTAGVSPTTATWLSITPSSGVAGSSEPIQVQAQAETVGLPYGVYDAEIDIAGDTGTMVLNRVVAVHLVNVADLENQNLLPIFREALP